MTSIAWTIGARCAKWLEKIPVVSRIPPNFLTLAWGMCLVGAGAWIGSHGFKPVWLVFVLIGSGILIDCLDGPVARSSYRQSALGAFLDLMMHLLGDTALVAGALAYLSRSEHNELVLWLGGIALVAVLSANIVGSVKENAEHELLDFQFQPMWSRKVSAGLMLFEPVVPVVALSGVIIGPVGFLILASCFALVSFIWRLATLVVIEHRTVAHKRDALATRVPVSLRKQREAQEASVGNRRRYREKRR